jgi:hypothetical protein
MRDPSGAFRRRTRATTGRDASGHRASAGTADASLATGPSPAAGPFRNHADAAHPGAAG